MTRVLVGLAASVTVLSGALAVLHGWPWVLLVLTGICAIGALLEAS